MMPPVRTSNVGSSRGGVMTLEHPEESTFTSDGWQCRFLSWSKRSSKRALSCIPRSAYRCSTVGRGWFSSKPADGARKRAACGARTPNNARLSPPAMAKRSWAASSTARAARIESAQRLATAAGPSPSATGAPIGGRTTKYSESPANLCGRSRGSESACCAMALGAARTARRVIATAQRVTYARTFGGIRGGCFGVLYESTTGPSTPNRDSV